MVRNFTLLSKSWPCLRLAKVDSKVKVFDEFNEECVSSGLRDFSNPQVEKFYLRNKD